MITATIPQGPLRETRRRFVVGVALADTLRGLKLARQMGPQGPLRETRRRFVVGVALADTLRGLRRSFSRERGDESAVFLEVDRNTDGAVACNIGYRKHLARWVEGYQSTHHF